MLLSIPVIFYLKNFEALGFKAELKDEIESLRKNVQKTKAEPALSKIAILVEGREDRYFYLKQQALGFLHNNEYVAIGTQLRTLIHDRIESLYISVKRNADEVDLAQSDGSLIKYLVKSGKMPHSLGEGLNDAIRIADELIRGAKLSRESLMFAITNTMELLKFMDTLNDQMQHQ